MIRHFIGEGGAVFYLDVVALPEGFQARLDRGDIIECEPDGTPIVPADEQFEDAPPPDAPPLPKAAAHRDVWIQFAISQGMPREEANSLTKKQLIERFTTALDPAPAPDPVTDPAADPDPEPS